MEGNIFVNVALTSALNDYLKFKKEPLNPEYNSFYVLLIRTLVVIYDELDLYNPFKMLNEKGLDNNFQKFGLSTKRLQDFKRELLIFYQNQDNFEVAQNAFLEIQKILVEMFSYRTKYINPTKEEIDDFKAFLYTREDTEPYKVDLYNKYTPNSDLIVHYFYNKIFEVQHNFNFIEHKDIALSAEAYQLAGYNAVSVLRMKEEEIENINNKVYHFFRIKDNDLNKRSRLESAINYYKKYGNTITSGNGYVDLLLILSIVSTGLMFLVIIGIIFL